MSCACQTSTGPTASDASLPHRAKDFRYRNSHAARWKGARIRDDPPTMNGLGSPADPSVPGRRWTTIRTPAGRCAMVAGEASRQAIVTVWPAAARLSASRSTRLSCVRSPYRAIATRRPDRPGGTAGATGAGCSAASGREWRSGFAGRGEDRLPDTPVLAGRIGPVYLLAHRSQDPSVSRMTHPFASRPAGSARVAAETLPEKGRKGSTDAIRYAAAEMHEVQATRRLSSSRRGHLVKTSRRPCGWSAATRKATGSGRATDGGML